MKNLKKAVSICTLALVMLVSFNVSGQTNSNNQFDYVGVLHNEIVNEFLKQFESKEMSIFEISQKIENIASKNKNFLKIKTKSYIPIDYKVIEAGVADFKNNFSNTIKNASVSIMAEKKLNSLVDYLIGKGFAENQTSYEDIKNYILNMEDAILANNSFTQKDLRVLLSATSMARHSSDFWNKYLKSKTENSQYRSSGRKWWQWLIIGVADVGGAIAGAAAGPGTAVTTGASASVAAYTITNPDKK